MELSESAARQRLAAFIREAAAADNVEIGEITRLGGGAVQENYAVDATIRGGPHAGNQALVLRTDARSGVAVSHGRAQEFQILRAAHAAGVTVPEPLWLCENREVLGRPFYLMRRIRGEAAGHIVVRDLSLGGPRDALAERLGRELARIHSIAPEDAGLDFLALPRKGPALHGVEQFRGYLDDLARPYPALEWGLRWLERNAPPAGEIVLAHHDFRTGNYMVDENGLTGILDWEFAGWSDRHEDIGWFCARCWRFGAWDKEAGGIAGRAPFYRGYEEESGRTIDPGQVYYWEVFAHMRWAVIALQQGRRHLSGEEPSLHLALTGRMAAEMEFEVLKMTAPEERSER